MQDCDLGHNRLDAQIVDLLVIDAKVIDRDPQRRQSLFDAGGYAGTMQHTSLPRDLARSMRRQRTAALWRIELPRRFHHNRPSSLRQPSLIAGAGLA